MELVTVSKENTTICFTEKWTSEKKSGVSTAITALNHQGYNIIQKLEFADVRRNECLHVVSQLNDLFQRFFLNTTRIMVVVRHENSLWAMLFDVGPGMDILKTHISQLDPETGFESLFAVWATKLGVNEQHVVNTIKYVFIVGVPVQSEDNLNYVTLDLDDSSGSSLFVGAPKIDSKWIADLAWLDPLRGSKVIAFTQFSIIKSNGQLGVWRKKMTSFVTQIPVSYNEQLIVIGDTQVWIYSNHALNVTFSIERYINNPVTMVDLIVAEIN